MTHLKNFRTVKGVSQQAVADYLGISRQAYGNYETGARECDYETLLKLAEYFDTSVDDILRGPSVADPFLFAMHGLVTELTEADKAQLEAMARLLVEKNKGGAE